MSKPIEFDPHESSTGLQVHRVPVIRIFGSTACGQQVCLHVHGYLPYFYLAVPEDVEPHKFKKKVHKTLEVVARRYFMERTILASRRRRIRGGSYMKPQNAEPDQFATQSQERSSCSYECSNTRSVKGATSGRNYTVKSRILSQSARNIGLLRRTRTEKTAFIHRVDVVEHVPFYGYHTRPKKFFKVYHYYPTLTKYLAAFAFHTGIHMRRLQPHEVHISYLMHFVSDYNIKGMDYIYLSSAIKMRGPLPITPRCFIQPHPLWQRALEASKKLRAPEPYRYMRPIVRNSPSVFLSEHKKISTCELEIDAHIATVLNVVELNRGLMNATQELSQFAVGGYMGSSNCFFEHWDQQCSRLNEASISSYSTNRDRVPTFASCDTLRRFYRFLMKETKRIEGVHADSVRATLERLLSECDETLTDAVNPHKPKSRAEEAVTIDPSFVHVMEDASYEEDDSEVYSYLYMVQPPRISTYEKGDRDCHELGFEETSDHSLERSDDIKSAKGGAPDSQSQGHSQMDHENGENQLEKLSEEEEGIQLVNQSKQHLDNFECGIVVDVVTDIELNRIHPDPQSNRINAVVYTIRDHRQKPSFHALGVPYADVQGAIIVGAGSNPAQYSKVKVEQFKKYALMQQRKVDMDNVERAIYSGKYVDVCYVPSEVQLIVALRNLILNLDPNIIYGYDIARNSIGYVHQRAAFLGIPSFIESISRILPRVRSRWHKEAPDEETDNSTRLTHQNSKLKKRTTRDSAIQPFVCIGRLLFDLMDVAIRELNMAELSLENIVYDQLGYVLPTYHIYTLNKWLNSKYPGDANGDKTKEGVEAPSLDGSSSQREASETNIQKSFAASPHAFRCISHMLLRNYCVLAVLDRMMYFQKYVTFSRLYGIDLKSTIVRGSQYHVESILIRFTKSCNYILPSPTERQVQSQRPSVAIPIVMQPISGFHVAPVAILDFQSLYSCITIAYNICYSTCLGLLSEHVKHKDKFKLGVVAYHPEKGTFQEVLTKGYNASVVNGNSVGVHVMPNGVMFVDRSVREGVLPTMLRSVLDSRRRIKAAMANNVGDEPTMQQWHHEQYGLKMISNLSVGLTASGFSGRMPCSDLAESVVAIARALILFCTEIVHDQFDAQVIYGDTDSIFIKFEGRTVEEAQALAAQIAETINASMPEPIKILPQKVYSPCALISKKRYVGMVHADGKMAFDDKGIETMRTSECSATRKILRAAMEAILRSVSLDAAYDELTRAFKSVFNSYTPKDFILYRQIRLGTYSEETTGKIGTLPAAAIVAKYKMHKHYGNRVLENEYIPHVFAVARSNEQRGVKESAVFPNEINGIFKSTEYIKEIGYRTLPQNSIANIMEQLERAKPLKKVNVEYYLKRQVIPPLRRMLQLLDIDPSVSITQEIFRRLQSTATSKEQSVNRIVQLPSQADDIWVYTGKHTKCINCGTHCTIKLGEPGIAELQQRKWPHDHFAEVLQVGKIELKSPQPNVVTFEAEGSGTHHIIICDDCYMKPKEAVFKAVKELNAVEAKLQAVHNICLNCTGNSVGAASCQNAWHCEVYFKRISYKKAFSRALKQYRSLLTLAYTD